MEETFSEPLIIPYKEKRTNTSKSNTLQVKSPILVKQIDWCYILGSPKPPIGTQVKQILIILPFLLLLKSKTFYIQQLC